MSYNKFALIRYKILNRCFRNTCKKFFIEDLIIECSRKLSELGTETGTISRRQILYDIAYMESSEGWNIDLLRLYEGKRVYYRYSNPNYSINNSPLTELEINQLRLAVSTLSQFEGLPQFPWIEDILTKLSSKVDRCPDSIISLDCNPYLKGLNYLSIIYGALINRTPISITYKPFTFANTVSYTIHPHFLKEYNNRWYVCGFCDEENKYSWILALDRIIFLKVLSIKYFDTKVEWKDYFEDIIGVTKYDNEELTTIILRFYGPSAHYVETKPLHGSQINKWIDNDTLEVTLSLYFNYELEQVILSFGEYVEVMEPNKLKEIIIKREQKAINRYV